MIFMNNDPFTDKVRKDAYTEAFNRGNSDARKGTEYRNPYSRAEQFLEDAYWSGWRSGGGKVPQLNARVIK